MPVYVDTSAFFAVLDQRDANHSNAKRVWEGLLSEDKPLTCSNYVVVESFALLQRRLGMQAVRVFQEDVLPLVSIEWVDESVHLAGATAMLAATNRELSLVDCTSFVIMRKLSIRDAFVYDGHFEDEGFNCLT